MNKKIFAGLAFIIPFIIYFITLAPNVMFTDSGELAGVCVNLGIAHSTGYPLFTILGHLWSLLPLGISKIMQMNLFSAIATSLGSFVFFFVSNEFIKLYLELSSKNKKAPTKSNKKDTPEVKIDNVIDDNTIYVISLVSSLIFAFGKTIWGQATSIEVYSLQIVFFNLITLFLLKTRDYSTINKSIIILAFSIGLGFANHMNTILIIPLVFWVYFFGFEVKPDFKLNKIWMLGILLIPILIGVSFYIYLPLRSMTFPDFNWGWVHRSWDKFIYHVSGKQYQVWMFTDPESVSKNFGIFFDNLPFEFAFIGLGLVLWGFIKLFKTIGLLLITLIMIISCMFYSLNYSIHDIDNYFILAYISLSLMMVIGFVGLIQFKQSGNLGKYFWFGFLGDSLNKKVLKNFAFILFLIPLWALKLNYSECDQSKNLMVSEYTNTMATNLDYNALIISRQWDYFCSAFWYKQKVEGLRPDVILIEKELLRRTWYIQQLKKMYPSLAKSSGFDMDNFLKDLELFESDKDGYQQSIQSNFQSMLASFIEMNIDIRPVYITLDLLQDVTDLNFIKQYNQIPQGYAIKLERKNNVGKIDLSKVDITKFVNSFKNDNDHLEMGIKEVTSNNLTNLGNYSFVKAGDTATAIRAFEMALKVNPENNLASQILAKLKK